MYSVRLTIPRDVFQAQRTAPLKARTLLATKIEREVQPQVERQAQDLLGREPGPVVHPFAFATAKSRRWYFWAFKGRLPYRRTGQGAKGWRVAFDRRLNAGQIRIYNLWEASGYVYGAGNPLASFRQVPGHARTGWGRDFPVALNLLQEFIVNLLVEAWYQAVLESLQ
jgi:hypothetical protein